MPKPTVTVICLCYNQGRFVREAVESVMKQTYPNIQLLLVDDASTDNSVDIINECLIRYPSIEFIPLSVNSGNCKAFNVGLSRAEGEYIIDLAADDVLLSERIEMGVMALSAAGDQYGVNFTDANWIAEDGRVLYRHSDKFPHDTVPRGDIYKELVARYFICSPTMMFRTSVIKALGGYDEALSYEDFDFWIRSSRDFLYCYTPEVLINKRVVRHSMSRRQFRILNPQARSTFRVCEKILALNRSSGEQAALSQRILYEMRMCARLLHLPLLWKYFGLWLRNRNARYD